MSDQRDTQIDDLILRYLKHHLNPVELEAFEIYYFEHDYTLDKIEQARLYLQLEVNSP